MTHRIAIYPEIRRPCTFCGERAERAIAVEYDNLPMSADQTPICELCLTGIVFEWMTQWMPKVSQAAKDWITVDQATRQSVLNNLIDQARKGL
jgi:hypothetical protein